MKKRVGLLTAGGDSPGLNAVLRGVGKAALESFGMEVVGFRDGFRGLMENRKMRLEEETLSGILTVGASGTLLVSNISLANMSLSATNNSVGSGTLAVEGGGLLGGLDDDGDPVPEARALCSMGSDDGATLVFNIHLSSAAGNPVELPASDEGLPDKFAKQLFEMSSSLTPFMIGRAKELGMPAGDGARGFVFNAQPMQVIQFLDIGTRPANLR